MKHTVLRLIAAFTVLLTLAACGTLPPQESLAEWAKKSEGKSFP